MAGVAAALVAGVAAAAAAHHPPLPWLGRPAALLAGPDGTTEEAHRSTGPDRPSGEGNDQGPGGRVLFGSEWQQSCFKTRAGPLAFSLATVLLQNPGRPPNVFTGNSLASKPDESHHEESPAYIQITAAPNLQSANGMHA